MPQWEVHKLAGLGQLLHHPLRVDLHESEQVAQQQGQLLHQLPLSHALGPSPGPPPLAGAQVLPRLGGLPLGLLAKPARALSRYSPLDQEEVRGV